MKTAICISGQPRNVHLAFPTINATLLEPNSPDVFIHLWLNKEDLDKPHFNSWGDSVRTIDNDIIGNIFKKYNPKKIKIENQIDFPQFNKYNLSPYQKNMVSMLYSMKQSNNLKKDYELENNFLYDAVIRSRFDLALEETIKINSLDLDDKVYCLKDCHYHNGVNDQFAVGNSKNMDIFNSTYDNLDEFLSTFKQYTSYACGETAVYHSTWLKNRITIIQLSTNYKLLRS